MHDDDRGYKLSADMSVQWKSSNISSHKTYAEDPNFAAVVYTFKAQIGWALVAPVLYLLIDVLHVQPCVSARPRR